jgi:hypothetical protein
VYRIVINTQTRPDGSTHTVVNSLATGTAIDNAGGAYHFNYHNHSSEDVAPGGFPIQLRFNDHFNLGRIESTLERRIGHRLDPRLANVGRLLWFDTITGLNNDNTCAGCHSPTNGFGDTQSIAIGIQNNGIVGPDRAGPHNERRAPMVINTAFFPNLMWNSRFVSPLVATPITLTSEEFGQLVAFVRDGLLDPRPSSSPS